MKEDWELRLQRPGLWAAVRPVGVQRPWAAPTSSILSDTWGAVRVPQRADYRQQEGSEEGRAASSPSAPPSLRFLSICQGGAIHKTEPTPRPRAPESPEPSALDTGTHARPSPTAQPHGVSRLFWETLQKGVLLAQMTLDPEAELEPLYLYLI